MKTNMEQGFINTVIAFKIMEYAYSLKSFFKDEFKKSEDEYVIPYSHIVFFKKNIFPLIRDSCDYVCPYQEKCHGHMVLDFIQDLVEFQCHSVIEKKCYFRDFRFYNFRLKRDKVHEMEIVSGWDFNYQVAKDLSHLSFSQRCQYLV